MNIMVYVLIINVYQYYFLKIDSIVRVVREGLAIQG